MQIATFLALALISLAAADASAGESGVVRISQVYAGGGHDTYFPQSWRTDYVELFNMSGSPADIGGWLLESGGSAYTSIFGQEGFTGIIPPGTTIQPCSYLLLQVGPTNTNQFSDAPYLPSPDVALSVPSLDDCGVLAVVAPGPVLDGLCLDDPRVQDLVKWCGGSCRWGVSPPGLEWTEGLVRLNGGMSSTGSNASDFEAVTNPVPRRGSSPANPLCLETPAVPATWGRLKTIFR
jgi:hypothetical protein